MLWGYSALTKEGCDSPLLKCDFPLKGTQWKEGKEGNVAVNLQ